MLAPRRGAPTANSHGIGGHKIDSESNQIKSLDWLIWEWELPDPGKNTRLGMGTTRLGMGTSYKILQMLFITSTKDQMSNAKFSTESGGDAPNRISVRDDKPRNQLKILALI